METSDQLLQLIARLQHTESKAKGRNLLLRYIRKQSKAQLVALFLLDKEQQILVPLASSGKLPEPKPAPATSSAKKALPANGLFGAALLTQEFLQVPDPNTDPRLLAEERHWTYPEGSALLQTLSDAPDRQAVLLLSFNTPQQDMPKKLSGDMRICRILLSTYLVNDAKRSSKPARRRRAPALELLQPSPDQQSTPPEVMYSLSMLSDLYEIGLVLNAAVDNQDLYQNILVSLSRVIQARFACLLLYHPSLRRLIPAARTGDELSCNVLVNAIDEIEIGRLTAFGPGQFLSFLNLGQQRVLLATLSYNGVLFGIVALALSEDNQLSDERSLLLTYMSNVAALLLRNHNNHTREVQAALEHERNRIARDIHDGSTQQITHVLYKLEFVQHLLTHQPLLPNLAQAANNEVERARTLLIDGLNELRHNISSLLPAQLTERNFVPALQNLLDDYRIHDPALTITLDIEQPDDLPIALETPIYRFIQEALTNVSKHARATHADISIRTTENVLLVEVQDDGIGFQPEPVAPVAVKPAAQADTTHLGLRTMRSRIEEAGGSLQLNSETNRGTCIQARFPLINSLQLLTDREHEILRLIVSGLSNRDIADRLSIGPETVKSHVRRILQKMQAKDRTQAAVLATRHGWL